MLKLTSLLFTLLVSLSARAEYRLGGYLGFGGTGLTSVNSIEGSEYNLQRSEGPGVVGGSLEYLTGNRTSIAFDHERGVFLSPFSSGVGFTGVTWRWFFRGDEPSLVRPKDGGSTLLIAKRIPFFGLSTGVAEGTIYRANDAVPTLHASGVYVGIHAGYDFQIVPSSYFRAEMMTAGTQTSAGFIKTSLSAFALQTGFVWIL